MLGAAIVGDGLFNRSLVVHQPGIIHAGIIHAFQLAGGRQGHFARVLFHKHIADTLVAIGESLFAHSEAGPRTNVRDAALFGCVVGNGAVLSNQDRRMNTVGLVASIAGIHCIKRAAIGASGIAIDNRIVLNRRGIATDNHCAASTCRRIMRDAAAADVDGTAVVAIDTTAGRSRAVIFYLGINDINRCRIFFVEQPRNVGRINADTATATAIAICADGSVAGNLAIPNGKVTGFTNSGGHIGAIHIDVLIAKETVDIHTAARVAGCIIINFAVGQAALGAAAVDIDAAAKLCRFIIMDIQIVKRIGIVVPYTNCTAAVVLCRVATEFNGCIFGARNCKRTATVLQIAVVIGVINRVTVIANCTAGAGCRVAHEAAVAVDGQTASVAVVHINSTAAASGCVVFKHGIGQGNSTHAQIKRAASAALVVMGINARSRQIEIGICIGTHRTAVTAGSVALKRDIVPVKGRLQRRGAIVDKDCATPSIVAHDACSVIGKSHAIQIKLLGALYIYSTAVVLVSGVAAKLAILKAGGDAVEVNCTAIS